MSQNGQTHFKNHADILVDYTLKELKEHCVKSVCVRCFSSPYILASGLPNVGKYEPD